MIEKFFLAFIPVFVAIDPIGLVAIFMGLGTSASHEDRKRQAFLGIFTALCVAVGFIFLGKIIFAALGITVADFQVAGGLILLGLAGRELLGLGPHDRGGSDEFGVVPLGMPLIAGHDRVLQCGSVYALDGQTRVARRIENNRAASGGDCREPDSPRLARRCGLICSCLWDGTF